MNRVLGDKKAYLIFILPALFIYALIVFVPILISGYYSLLQWDGISDPVFVGLSNFKALFENEAFFFSFRNSLILAVASVVF